MKELLDYYSKLIEACHDAARESVMAVRNGCVPDEDEIEVLQFAQSMIDVAAEMIWIKYRIIDGALDS